MYIFIIDIVYSLFIERGDFQAVRIDLGQKDVRRTVHSILQTCNLSTSYIDSLPHQPNLDLHRNTRDGANQQNSHNYKAQYWNNFQDYNVDDVERDLSQRRSVPNDLQYVYCI